jgi:hypothetical protein
MPTITSYALLMMLGINTHIPFAQFGYQNIPTLEANLKYLGVKVIRDSAEQASDVPAISAIATAAGVKVNDFVGETSAAQMLVDMSLMNSYAPGILASVEGPNEEDGTYAVGLGNSLVAAAAVQKTLWTLGQTLQLPVINMSFGAGWTGSNGWIGDYATQGDLSAWCTWGNAHTYPQANQTPAYAMNFVNGLAKSAAKTRPIATTEIGWQTTVFSQPVIAKYVIDAALDGVLLGNTAVYYYATYDDGSGNWGFFNADGTPRPAATALHNLTALLADSATPFTPAAFSPTIAGQIAGDSYQTIAKSDGSFMLAMWNESQAPGVTHNVTITLPSQAATLALFDPTVGTAPVATWANAASVQVGVSDHPQFLAVSNPPACPTATTSTGTIAFTSTDAAGNKMNVTGPLTITTTPSCP